MLKDPNSKADRGSTGSFTAISGERPDIAGPCNAGGALTGLDAYAYGLLDPAHGAAGANRGLLGAVTLGIEVTVPELARDCGLGNIDPQHGGGNGIGTSSAAAIETCLAPPPAGATLVTVRPDLDAFGAMALLAFRRAGGTPSPAMQARIDRVARADRFDHGPWPGPRPLPATLDDFVSAMNQDPALIAVTGAMFDRELTVRDRVGIAASWLETGAEPAGYRERWAAHARVLIEGLASGAVAVEERLDGRVALVTSRLPGCLRFGYSRAPVVVAHNPGSLDADPPAPRRVFIAQYACLHVDLAEVRDALARQEPGWGGSSTLIGSPQDRPCSLELETIVAAVARHLRVEDAGPGRSAP